MSKKTIWNSHLGSQGLRVFCQSTEWRETYQVTTVCYPEHQSQKASSFAASSDLGILAPNSMNAESIGAKQEGGRHPEQNSWNDWGVSDTQPLRDCQKRWNFRTDRVSRWTVNKEKPDDWNHKDGADICVPHHTESLSVRWWPCWGSDIGRRLEWGEEGGWKAELQPCHTKASSLYILT